MEQGEEPLTSEQVTKGQAADMLTKWKFGAKGWFEKLEGRRRKVERVERSKEEAVERRRREVVRVGPLEV